MSESPTCLVVGIGSQDPSVIVKGLLQVEELVASQDSTASLTYHPWQIDNKYYSASVQIGSTSSTSDLDQTLKNRVEASIMYFDSSKKNDLSHIETVWLPVLEECDSLDIKILVCDSCVPEENQTGTSKLEAQKWCLNHGFELVELEPTEEPDPDDDFPETLGMQRIIQALHAHSWPNLEMKGEGDRKTHNRFAEALQKEATDEKPADGSLLKLTASSNSDYPAADGIDSFEELFQAMAMMKSQASALEGADRKAYAEKITMAFWRAIDGDANEIAGLDSSGDEEQHDP